MERRWVYVYLAVFIALFLILNSLGFFGEKGRLTGFAVIGEYENQTDCVGAGYTWEIFTNETCTTIPDCVIGVTGCVDTCEECEDVVIGGQCIDLDYITEADCVNNNSTWEIFTNETCTTIPDCVIGVTGCVDTCEECEDVVIGGQCIGDVCDATHLTLCLNETNCVDVEGYWYGDVCNAEAECVPDTCGSLSYTCGSSNDGCGGTLDCGTCDSEYSCVSGVCEEDEEEAEEQSTTQVSIEESKAADSSSTTDTTPQPTPAPTPSPTPAPTPSPITGGIVEDEAENETCEGCLLNNRCYEIDKRKKGKYCLDDLSWANQTVFNQTCTEDVECKSNSCEEEKCTKSNFITALLNWFKELFEFGIPLNQTSNETANLSV